MKDSVFVNGIELSTHLNEETLEKLLASWPEKWAAFEALGNKGTVRSLEILKKYALSKDKYEEIAAITALSHHTLGAHATDIIAHIITEKLSNADPLLISPICDAVGKLGLKQFHTEISSLLKSKNPDIRRSAIYAIDGIWFPSDLDTLQLMYQKDQACRKDAAFVLYQHVDSHNWKSIFQLFANDKQVDRHRVWSCCVASEYGEKDIIGAIKTLSNDKNGHVRRYAERALLILEKK